MIGVFIKLRHRQVWIRSSGALFCVHVDFVPSLSFFFFDLLHIKSAFRKHIKCHQGTSFHDCHRAMRISAQWMSIYVKNCRRGARKTWSPFQNSRWQCLKVASRHSSRPPSPICSRSTFAPIQAWNLTTKRQMRLAGRSLLVYSSCLLKQRSESRSVCLFCLLSPSHSPSAPTTPFPHIHPSSLRGWGREPLQSSFSRNVGQAKFCQKELQKQTVMCGLNLGQRDAGHRFA